MFVQQDACHEHEDYFAEATDGTNIFFDWQLNYLIKINIIKSGSTIRRAFFVHSLSIVSFIQFLIVVKFDTFGTMNPGLEYGKMMMSASKSDFVEFTFKSQEGKVVRSLKSFLSDLSVRARNERQLLSGFKAISRFRTLPWTTILILLYDK